MRLGVLSDLHCNTGALQAGLAQMQGRVDEILVAGDIVYEYRFSSEIVDVLRTAGARCILGNHDTVLLGPAGARARAAKHVDPGALAHLASLPLQLESVVGGKRLLMVHASPWPPFGDYLHPASPVWKRADELGVDFLLTGHTHVPFAGRYGRTLVVNPGSISEPRGPGMPRVGTYAIIDTDTDEVTIEGLAPQALMPR